MPAEQKTRVQEGKDRKKCKRQKVQKQQVPTKKMLRWRSEKQRREGKNKTESRESEE